MTQKTSNTTANASIAQAQYKAMAAVGEKAKTWSETSHKKATDELYALLAECYAVTLQTRAQSAAVMRELNKLLVEKHLKFNDGTKLETKVVRVVFGRGGSVCLNRFWAFLKWFSALVTPLPHLAVAD
jgi:hypothetical protein